MSLENRANFMENGAIEVILWWRSNWNTKYVEFCSPKIDPFDKIQRNSYRNIHFHCSTGHFFRAGIAKFCVSIGAPSQYNFSSIVLRCEGAIFGRHFVNATTGPCQIFCKRSIPESYRYKRVSGVNPINLTQGVVALIIKTWRVSCKALVLLAAQEGPYQIWKYAWPKCPSHKK